MKPNLETTVEILGQKLMRAELESAQWQSVANDLAEENEQYKKKYESESDNAETHEVSRG